MRCQQMGLGVLRASKGKDGGRTPMCRIRRHDGGPWESGIRCCLRIIGVGLASAASSQESSIPLSRSSRARRRALWARRLANQRTTRASRWSWDLHRKGAKGGHATPPTRTDLPRPRWPRPWQRQLSSTSKATAECGSVCVGSAPKLVS